MIVNFLIAALVFTWFLFLANLAYRIVEKNFSRNNRKREPDHFSRNR
jgi:hypothetical protein